MCLGGGVPVSARCPPIEPQNLKWLNCPVKEHEAFAQSSEKDPNGRDRPPRISCHTDDAGTREDALGPRAKSLGLPHTPYPFNTPLRPVPESYQPPKPGASPGSTKPNPQPPTHFHSTHLSIPPKSRWGAGPSAALHLEERYLHCEDEEADATEGAAPQPGLSLPLNPKAHIAAACWHLRGKPTRQSVGMCRQGLLLSFPAVVSPMDRMRFGWIICEVHLSSISV